MEPDKDLTLLKFEDGRNKIIAGIKRGIEKRYGTVVDTVTGVQTRRPFEEINLIANCGEVSRITNREVGGEIKEKTVRGRNPSIVYNDGNDKFEIASGFTVATHSYVVDKGNKVWDPTTNNWGETEEEEYLKRLV